MSRLTRREKEIMSLVAKGLPSKEIADELGLTHGSVRTMLTEIYKKMSVSTRVEASNKYHYEFEVVG